MKRLFLLIFILPFVSWAQVDSLRLNNSQKNSILKISCNKDLFPKDAVYVIDGVYSDNKSLLIEINSNEIETIRIIKETSEILPHLRKPIVIVNTKKV